MNNSFDNFDPMTEINSTVTKHSLAVVIGSAIFLTVIAVIGTVGNIFIVYAVISQKALRKVKSNYFVCNLALADFIVTAVVIPTAVGNVIIDRNESILPETACKFVAYLMPFTCVVSMLNLMLVGVQRFIGISSLGQQQDNVEKRMAITLVLLSWVWAALIAAPMILTDPYSQMDLLGYDSAAAMCAWNDQRAPRFTVAMVIVAFFVPLGVTALCYYELFTNVTRQSRDMTTKMEGNGNSKISERERKLLETIMIVIAVFILSWGPYCMLLVLDTLGIVDVLSNENWKKPAAWLGCANSAFNSVIYGWRNDNFRQGYIECGYKLADFATCKRFDLYRSYTKKRAKQIQSKRNMRSLALQQQQKVKTAIAKTAV